VNNEKIYEAIERSLSKPRMSAYTVHSSSTREAFERYFWNVELSSALYIALNLLEISLRSELYFRAKKWHDQNKNKTYQRHCFWFEDERLMHPPELSRVSSARNKLADHGIVAPSEDQIVAELPLGFWSALFSRRYVGANPNYFGLWPDLWKPERFFKYCSGQNRNHIRFYDIVDPIHRFCNRVAHHEPIYSRPNLLKEYQDIKLLLGWIDPVLPAQLDVICDFEPISTRGVADSRWALANPA
jgi:hypothetical protein